MKERTKGWIEFVKRDLASARELLKNEYLTNVVLFHCQQAVEKVLKAVLEEKSLKVPRIHSVIKLYYEYVPTAIQEQLHFSEINLEKIDDIYLDGRYPDTANGILPEGFPTKEDAEEIFQMASGIVNRTINFLESEK